MTTMELQRVSKLVDQHDTLTLNTNQPFGLKDLAYEVEQAIPGCRVTPENDRWSWVYMPDDHYAMGMLGYGNFSGSGNGGETYTVKSRTIDNRKYRSGSSQHHMKMSTSLPTAVKNARAYLRRYSPMETAKYTRGALRHTLSSGISLANEQARTATYKALSAVPNSDSQLFAELQHLLDIEHTFLDPALPAQLRDMFAAVEAFREKVQIPNMTFVQILPYQDTERWDVIDVDGASDFTLRYGEVRSPVGDSIETDISEDIRGKVSVLSMLDDDTYVTGVGYKILNGIYYVTQ